MQFLSIRSGSKGCPVHQCVVIFILATPFSLPNATIHSPCSALVNASRDPLRPYSHFSTDQALNGCRLPVAGRLTPVKNQIRSGILVLTVGKYFF